MNVFASGCPFWGAGGFAVLWGNAGENGTARLRPLKSIQAARYIYS